MSRTPYVSEEAVLILIAEGRDTISEMVDAIYPSARLCDRETYWKRISHTVRGSDRIAEDGLKKYPHSRRRVKRYKVVA